MPGSEGIKLVIIFYFLFFAFFLLNLHFCIKSNEIQDEITRLLCSPTSKINSIILKNSNLKSDFFQKLSALTSHQSKFVPKIRNTNFIKHINLSRNSIEDKGAAALATILKEFQLSQFNYLSLSKCSINSKGVNTLATGLRDCLNTLSVLDLSSNNLKDDPVVS